MLAPALIQNVYPKRFKHLFTFNGSTTYLRHYETKKYGLRHAFTAVMVAYQSALLALALFTVFKRFHAVPNWGADGLLRFVLIAVALLALELLNLLLHLFFSSLFELETLGHRCLQARYYLRLLSSIPLIPLLLLCYYSPLDRALLNDGLLIFIVFYHIFWQILLVSLYWKALRRYLLHFFLYLCSLEVLPLLWLAKSLLF